MSTTDPSLDATSPAEATTHRARIPHILRIFCVPVLLGWLALTALLNVVVPQLEVVGAANSTSLTPNDAPSLQATKLVGQLFHEYDSNSSAMIVLESDQPLGAQAHQYYDGLVADLEKDTTHVEHVQDLWSDPLTSSGSQSADNKATYVQLYIAGNQGETLANDSVQAVRDIVAKHPPPPGLKVYVTGPGPLNADLQHAGDKSLALVTALTFGVIIVMLLLVYRSIVTVLFVLLMVVLELAVSRGVVAFAGYYHLISLSTFAVNLLTLLAIAAATDYAIFFVGRYHEARNLGDDRETAFYVMYHGTAHVVLGSGLTIAGATLCLHFTRLPYFQSLGIPLAIGMFVVTMAALTLLPALLTVASRFGLLEPKRQTKTRGWRRIGTAIVRWPGPILVASTAVTLVGLLALPSYTTSYDDKRYIPADVPANVGYAAAARHFPQSRLNPEVLMLVADHDLRNSTDMLIINRVAKDVFHLPGIARVQTITRPLGTPIDGTSIPYIVGQQGVNQKLGQSYSQARTSDLLTQAADIANQIGILRQQLQLQKQSAAATQEQTNDLKQTVAVTNDLRDNIANFDDFFRPIRAYFYWEPHCYDIPVCYTIRSLFDALDGVDELSDLLQQTTVSLDKLNALQPKLLALLPPQIASQETNRNQILTNYATQEGQQSLQDRQQSDPNAIGRAFDDSKIDDSFYLPPEVFDNPDFKRGLKQFVSPDGKAVRFIITHQGDPATPEGISHVDEIKNAAFEAIKGTPLETSKIYLGGTAATYKDMRDGSNYDLIIAGISALCLIFVIMLIITRAVVAALVIVGTVALSLASSFGLAVLLWQHIIGLELHWLVLAMSVIILLAVGSDYNLLLVSRFKEERDAGLKTGIIRAIAGSGSVVTSAGLVFAFTMMSFAISDLKVMAQVGTTIGLGLLVDTLVIRSFLTPSIAALLGRWFWWPQVIRTRPARRVRPLVSAAGPGARDDDPPGAT
ncbi:membrane protein [Mycolicibacterium madagascariense]|uniref:Membrane protein n=1 Tax=Mycolicibacterium madagascariense TaxID=212765 RepID=A0A7I7XMH1_9MYCO|nr:MMPL family transporter [Mycolicibacterium madagascariense]MCV7012561.1 MMPL family transporter [Mycolicibacterium madagascariense]BBZ30242.1 membrane protein [Mycolicibacterium madagascariense]